MDDRRTNDAAPTRRERAGDTARLETALLEAALLDRLRALLGEPDVLTGELTAGFTVDYTGRFGGPALAVVRPRSTQAVADVVRACAEAGVPVLPQGGNTGLVGGGVPAAGGAGGGAVGIGAPVIVSTRGLDALAPVDALAGQVTVGAGTTLGDVQRHVRASGWEYGVDLGARDSATIGGTIATNAGGVHVIAHGMTRAQVVGIEAVLPDGSVVSHLSGLVKDNTGYDLAGLLVGSEGTLGVITAARLRLVRPSAPTTLVLVGADGWEDALALMATARGGQAPLLAAEVVDAAGVDLVCELTGMPWPLAERHPLVCLFDIADGADGSGVVLPDDADAVVATDGPGRARLWTYRERLTEGYAALAGQRGRPVHKLDVAVPLAQLSACATAIAAAVTARGDTVGLFGHLGDGNLHVQVIGLAADDPAVDDLVLGIVAAHDGSVSAEHGIGRAKVHALGRSRSPAEIAAMRAIKSALDPAGLLNPGVLLPADDR